MDMKSLRERAKAFLAAFPDTKPEEIYINGFLAGYRQKWHDDEDPEPVDRVEYESVRGLFNLTCPSFSKVASLSKKRKEKVHSRWMEMTELGAPVEVCQKVFEKMEASSFLKGNNNRKWKATFDWVFENSNNWVKVYEGQYDDRADGTSEKRVNNYWDGQD